MLPSELIGMEVERLEDWSEMAARSDLETEAAASAVIVAFQNDGGLLAVMAKVTPTVAAVVSVDATDTVAPVALATLEAMADMTAGPRAATRPRSAAFEKPVTVACATEPERRRRRACEAVYEGEGRGTWRGLEEEEERGGRGRDCVRGDLSRSATDTPSSLFSLPDKGRCAPGSWN